MDLQLRNKLALVTASSGGIGLAIAETLAAEGARVIINGRSEGTVSSAIAQLGNNLPEARFLPLAADNGTAEGTAKTIGAFPEVDILVNNLGIYEAVGFFDEKDWAKGGLRVVRPISTAARRATDASYVAELASQVLDIYTL